MQVNLNTTDGPASSDPTLKSRSKAQNGASGNGHTPNKRLLPRYVVAQGKALYFRRRVPPDLVVHVGSATITERIDAQPGSRAFQRAYGAALGRSGLLLDQAREQARRLSPVELAGVAGASATSTPLPESRDTLTPEAVAAVLEALCDCGIALPMPPPEDWCPDSGSVRPEVVQALMHRLDTVIPTLALPMSEDLYGELTPQQAADRLRDVVAAGRQQFAHWIGEASRQLQLLGVAVDPVQRQATAARIIRLGLIPKAQQLAAFEAGQVPPPLPEYPPPPQPLQRAAGTTLQQAVEAWATRRRPAAKTVQDTQGRIRDLIDWLGSDQLHELTAGKAREWVQHLLHGGISIQTVARRIALVKAALGAARDAGLPVDAEVLDALSSHGLRPERGTTATRRPFTTEEAGALWNMSRRQAGHGRRPLDRWGFPLGLATGMRLEEIAGLRLEDVREVDGMTVLVVRPHEDRRLKSGTSERIVPVPEALVSEGFLEWAHGSPQGLLFPEPKPPAADPRLSHYASIRLGKLLRGEAGITDPTAVFHSCRHFTCQQLVDAGVEQRLIEALVGHASRSMTARYRRQGPPLRLLAEAMGRRDWGWVPAT